MKKIVTITSFLIAIAANSAFAEVKTISLQVENMTCATCPLTVRMSLLKVEGVKEAHINFIQKVATVTFDEKRSSIVQLTAATTNAGYPSTVLD